MISDQQQILAQLYFVNFTMFFLQVFLSVTGIQGAPDISVDTQHVTSSSVIKAREDTAEDTKSTGVQQRTLDGGGLIRQHLEMGEDANVAPDEDY